jgi:hypothetical protein
MEDVLMPNFDIERTDNVDPIPEDKVPATDNVEPKLTNPRREHEDPRFMMSKIETRCLPEGPTLSCDLKFQF